MTFRIQEIMYRYVIYRYSLSAVISSSLRHMNNLMCRHAGRLTSNNPSIR